MSWCPCGDDSPPWEVLVLVAARLDPKTLAMASCVCKSWLSPISADYLWHPICSTYFPSLSKLHSVDPNVPYRRLYALGHASAKLRLQKPLKPRLSLHNLVFVVDVRYGGRRSGFTVVKPGAELNLDPNGLFRFDIDSFDEKILVVDALDGLRVAWNMVLKGFEGVFTMMDCKGKGSFVPAGRDGWFSEELPSPGCCSGAMMASGLAADLRLGLGGEGDGKVVVEKVGVGMLSIVSWRYLCVDDALRYLQHFLMPSAVL